MKTIVVPVDFSDVSEKVVDTAVALAGAFGSRVVLVHVEEPEPQFVGYDPGPLSVRVAMPTDLEGDERRLEALKKKFGGGDVLAFIAQGAIPEEILKLAREHEATLIVMGSHGHGALYHLLAGSVTAAILKEGLCPVLVVPSEHGSKRG